MYSLQPSVLSAFLLVSATNWGVIAARLGHADTQMTEKHYAHVVPSYGAEATREVILPRKNFRPLGPERWIH